MPSPDPVDVPDAAWYFLRDSGGTVENNLGWWVPSIPLPGWERRRFRRSMRCRCTCGVLCDSFDAYRGHYALRHILEL